MDTIGVGLIGTGFMGKCHALAWTNVQAVFGDTPVVRRLALCEVDEALARQRAKEFGFEKATVDWRALVADPTVDVVSITTPTVCTRRWRSPLSKPASMSGAKSRWRLSLAERRAHGRCGAGERPGRDPRL